MTNMEDVFTPYWGALFERESTLGNITLRNNQEFPELTIANYTPKAAYEGTWNAVTRAARGLIYNNETGEILARPFAKFFNYGQKEAPQIDLDAPLYGVGNKFDGSLGIGYVRPDGQFAIATRGSFHSTQADHANAKIVADAYGYPYQWHASDVAGGFTPLFEIIYPDNRIVLDYEQQDYLQPLGWVKIDTGEYVGPGSEELFERGGTFREVLSWLPRPNAEGYVVWLDTLTAVKIKQDDYIALHAIITNLSERKVWEVAKEESVVSWRAFVEALPDELQNWAENVRDAIVQKVWADESRLYIEHEKVVDVAWDAAGRPSDEIPRKEFALAVQRDVAPSDRWAMFSIADGKSIVPKLFDLHKPVGVGSRPSGSLAAEEG